MELQWNTPVLRERERLSYEKQFYTVRFNKKRNMECIYGFPCRKGQWCTSTLKTDVLNRVRKGDIRENSVSKMQNKHRPEEPAEELEGRFWESGVHNGFSEQMENMVYRRTKAETNEKFFTSSLAQGADTNIVQYLGIAADEPERIERHTKPGFILPLVDMGWDEAYCRKWCEENDLLSPIYTDSTRGGCWFCHNQGVDQLRILRHKYPEYWKMLLKWDNDSPVSFHSDGRTVHDFEKRFSMEDCGLIPTDRKFKWKMLTEHENEWLDELLK